MSDYIDRDSARLTIEASTRSDKTAFLQSERGVFVPAADLPEIVAELYKAAGVPAPIVHEHIDDEGAGLSIKSSEFRPSTAFVESCIGVYVTPEDLPGLVRKLYEAAGQEPPILLPRRTPEAVWVSDGRVRPLIMPMPNQDMEPAEARSLAAWYASAADLAEAEAEPDPEQVKQLADVIEKAGVLGSAREEIARAILAAGYTRSES